MRSQRIVLGSVVGVFAVATLAYCCGTYGAAQTTTVKLSSPLQSALVRDGKLYAVNDQGELLMLARPNAELQSLGKFDGKLLDIAGDKGCFAIKNMLYVADLANGTILASQAFKTPPSSQVCFVGPDRLAVLYGASVQILDAATVKTLDTIELQENAKAPEVSALACQAQDGRLYVATRDAQWSGVITLAVIDVQNRKIVDHIPVKTAYGLDEFYVHKDKAFLLCHNHGCYGVWSYDACCVDLKTREVSKLDVPLESGTGLLRNGVWPGSVRVFGRGDNFCIVGRAGVYEYDAQGKLIGTALPKRNSDGRFLTAWGRGAVIAGKEALEIVPLTFMTARSK